MSRKGPEWEYPEEQEQELEPLTRDQIDVIQSLIAARLQAINFPEPEPEDYPQSLPDFDPYQNTGDLLETNELSDIDRIRYWLQDNNVPWTVLQDPNGLDLDTQYEKLNDLIQRFDDFIQNIESDDDFNRLRVLLNECKSQPGFDFNGPVYQSVIELIRTEAMKELEQKTLDFEIELLECTKALLPILAVEQPNEQTEAFRVMPMKKKLDIILDLFGDARNYQEQYEDSTGNIQPNLGKDVESPEGSIISQFEEQIDEVKSQLDEQEVPMLLSLEEAFRWPSEEEPISNQDDQPESDQIDLDRVKLWLAQCSVVWPESQTPRSQFQHMWHKLAFDQTIQNINAFYDSVRADQDFTRLNELVTQLKEDVNQFNLFLHYELADLVNSGICDREIEADRLEGLLIQSVEPLLSVLSPETPDQSADEFAVRIMGEKNLLDYIFDTVEHARNLAKRLHQFDQKKLKQMEDELYD